MGKLLRWTKLDDEKLINNSDKSNRFLSELLDRSIPSIKNRKNKLCLTNTNLWSQYEIKILTKYYSNSDKKILLDKIPNRTWTSILSKAKELKLNRLDYYHNSKRTSNVNKLLDNSLQSNYYIGLLMADGYITNNKIIFSQSLKDKNIVINFAKYINCNNITEYNRIDEIEILGRKTKYNGKMVFNVKDSIVIPKILEKYSIIYEKNNKTKTYYPPNIDNFNTMSDNELLSYIIGFIDGDGSISKKRNNGNTITITSHMNWLPVLEYFRFKLSKIFNIKFSEKSITIENNIVRFKIYNSTIINGMLKLIFDNNICVNFRKWGRI